MTNRKISIKFTTFDLVLMALLAVANAIITVYLSYVNKMLTAIGGPVATSTTVGIYMIYGVLAMYIIRKPGTAFITFMIGATLQSLFNISYGMASAYIAALAYAVGVEAIYALGRYKRWGRLSIVLASLLATIIWFPFAAYMFGYLKWSTFPLVLSFVIRCVSGVVLCGLITKWIGDRLASAKLLKSYAISHER